MTNHLADIVTLQALLLELAAAEQRLTGIPDWMKELHEEHQGRLAAITELENAAEAARHDRRGAESAVADAQEKLKRYQQQLNQVSTQREYGALLHEIDTAKAQIAAAEEQGLAAMERRDLVEGELGEARNAFEELDARYKGELERWEGEKPAIAQRIDELKIAASSLREALPRGILAHFDRVRERNRGEGLAAIQEVNRGGRGPRFWHCGACNYSVRPQVVVEVRSGALIQCEGCKRILYVPETAA